ncbi:MAG: helix-turn-helix domain-containing protein [Bacteroidota bacterium]
MADFGRVSNVRKKNLKYLKAFGANLCKIRVKKGLSQEELSYRTGMSFTSINRIESGKINTTVASCRELAKALEVPTKDLFDF